MDALNDKAYDAHYRSVDSVEHYAQQALSLSHNYDDGRAEALCHLAFVSMVRMNYAKAEQQLSEAAGQTDNQIEQFVAEVQLMRLCQRRSRNREFYEHRERAMNCLRRIDEERATLSERNRRRMVYGESELAIVNSTYYYYVGLERQASEALLQMDEEMVHRDTAQYLNYLYNIGAGGIIIDGTAEDIAEQEMENLNRCVSMAERYHYPYFEANAKEALAERLTNLDLAAEALQLFQQYGDVYQIAGAHRSLATCYHAMGNDREALRHAQIRKKENFQTSFTAPEAKVLIVDDNKVNLKVAEGLLRPYQMKVDTADSGGRAIEKIQGKEYDLVFMDHMMPKMDGVDATKIIRELNDPYYKQLPIIALSANAVRGAKEMFLEAGMNDFVPKPIEMRVMDRVLRRWLPADKIHTMKELTAKIRRIYRKNVT